MISSHGLATDTTPFLSSSLRSDVSALAVKQLRFLRRWNAYYA